MSLKKLLLVGCLVAGLSLACSKKEEAPPKQEEAPKAAEVAPDSAAAGSTAAAPAEKAEEKK